MTEGVRFYRWKKDAERCVGLCDTEYRVARRVERGGVVVWRLAGLLTLVKVLETTASPKIFIALPSAGKQLRLAGDTRSRDDGKE